MKMKRWSAIFGAVLLCTTPFKAYSLDRKPDGISLTGGDGLNKRSELSNFRAAVRWDWDADLLNSRNWRLDGYFDLGYSQWKSRLSREDQPTSDGAKKAWQVSLTPVFRLSPKTDNAIVPFVDFGVGVSYQSKKNLEKESRSPLRMGGHTQFEGRLMVGFQFGDQHDYEIAYGWFHYSNASLHPNNDGLDFQMLSFVMKW